MDNFPQLETEKLILRAAVPSDAEALFRVFSDEEVTRYHDIETVTELQQIDRLISRWAERFRTQSGIRWGIAQKQDNTLIGSCGYRYVNPFTAEIGYELAKTHWRQGIMTDALEAVIRFGFEQQNLNRIEATVLPDNIASIKLLRKLSFIEEGTLREYGYWKNQFHDLKMFSLLKKEY